MRAVLLPAVLLLAALLLPGVARADTHAVTIRNAGPETIRGIYFGGGGDSRLRHDLPQGAEARITYSTSCRADIRIAYASGRTEEHPGVDVCSDPRVTAGTDGTPGAPMPAQAAAPAGNGKAQAAPGKTAAATTAASAPATPVRAPPPVVPPWTGKSITKRFGGMD